MEGTVHSSLENFDQDEIAAFVLDYRQYTQNNDPISIQSLASIYNRSWIDVGARKRFEEIRTRLNRMLDANCILTFGDYSMSVRTLIEIVVYGGLAHSNTEKAEIFESWETSGIMGFVWAEFFAAMRQLMHTLKTMRSLNEVILSLYELRPQITRNNQAPEQTYPRAVEQAREIGPQGQKAFNIKYLKSAPAHWRSWVRGA